MNNPDPLSKFYRDLLFPILEEWWETKVKSHPIQFHITSPDEDQIFNAQEACNFLKIKLPTLYAYTSKGVLPTLKKGKNKGGYLRFSKKELEAWVREGRVATLQDRLASANKYLESNLK